MTKFDFKIKNTNNPQIIKFESNQALLQGRSYEYQNIDDATNSPLAQKLFHFPFVKSIFITRNFISIEGFNSTDWKTLKDIVKEFLINYLNADEPILKFTSSSAKDVNIYVESTPNPDVMKFVTNKKLSDSPVEVLNKSESDFSNLSKELFNFNFINRLFIDKNYISITKNNDTNWEDIVRPLKNFIQEFLNSKEFEVKRDIVSTNTIQENENVEKIIVSKTDDAISLQIIDILEEYIKPAVAADGGNIAFDSYDEKEKIVKVLLQGACSGCPSSTATLKNGIETMLKEMIPNKINEVIAING